MRVVPGVGRSGNRCRFTLGLRATDIIATQISKGDWTMKLRDEEDGQPLWECCFPGQGEMQ